MEQCITILQDRTDLTRARDPLFLISLYFNHYSSSGEWSQTNEGVIYEGYNRLLEESYPGFGKHDDPYKGFPWEESINQFFKGLLNERQVPNDHCINVVGLYDCFSNISIQSHCFDHRDYHHYRTPHGYNYYNHGGTHNFVRVPLTKEIVRFLNKGILIEQDKDNQPAQADLPYFLNIWQGNVSEQEIDQRLRERFGKEAYESLKEHDIRGAKLSLNGDVLKVEEPYFEHGLSERINRDGRSHSEDRFVLKGINTYVNVPLTDKVKQFISELKTAPGLGK